MNEAGRQCETLFPSTGKLAGKLIFAFREREFFETFTHGLSPVLHVVHACDKIEILCNAQILPKTESLGHVTDFTLDRFAFSDDVMTQDSATAIVGTEQPAKHPQKGGLAAAVRAEESVNLPAAHR